MHASTLKLTAVAALLMGPAGSWASYTLYKGSGSTSAISGPYDTLALCKTALAKYRKKANCRGTPTPCPAKPADVTTVNACPLPSIGEWTSTSVSVAAPSPTCWTAGTPTPAIAPAGACTVPPPAPAPEPLPDMSSTAVYVDSAKLPTKSTGYADFRVKDTTEIAPDSTAGAFRTVCTLSHMAFDDPIVFPGQAGKSHLHAFFGNTGANANSTAESLRSTGNSTCRGGIANRSAYWVPAMIDTKDGSPLVPTDIGVYYKNGKIDGTLIQPMPEGLRMIAGTPSAKGPISNPFAARFKCIGGPNKQNALYGPAIGNCDVGAHLTSEVFFPQCWDGKNLDSPDHKAHMSYTLVVKQPDSTWKRECPATHPVPLPEVTFNVVYQVTEKDAPLRWRLASDNYDLALPGGYSSHADWFNGWQKPISDSWATNCIRAKKDCKAHLLGDGRAIY